MPRCLAQSNAPPRGAVPDDMDIGPLYRRHQPWLVDQLGRTPASGQDAADVGHDTVLCLLNLDNLDSLHEPRRYLLAIASRLLINRCRRDRAENESGRRLDGDRRAGHGRWTLARRSRLRSGDEL